MVAMFEHRPKGPQHFHAALRSSQAMEHSTDQAPAPRRRTGAWCFLSSGVLLSLTAMVGALLR